MLNGIRKEEKEYTSNNLFAGIGINRDVVVDVVERERADSLFADWIKSNMIKVSRLVPGIKNVIFNEPATIVFWRDGTKTVVKSRARDIYDPEKGLAMAIAKKALGNKGSYYNEFSKYTDIFEKYDAREMARMDSPRPDSAMNSVVTELVTNMLENNKMRTLKSIVHFSDSASNGNTETIFFFTIEKPIATYCDSIELMVTIPVITYSDDVSTKISVIESYLLGSDSDARIEWSPTKNGIDYDWNELTLNKTARRFLFGLICDFLNSLHDKSDAVNPYEIV